ncbi:MAG: hypothetical protein ACYC2O_11335 [Microthrixaceae bacterium]
MIERVRRWSCRRARRARRARLAQRSGAPSSRQDGFALMSVLAIIALTSITIAALLGMLLTMIRITADQEQAARDARAADGAATAAINHLRMNQDDNTNACSGVPTAGMRVPFIDVGTATDVQVTCRKAADEFGEPGGELKLVGSDYGGRLNWASWPWTIVPVSPGAATPSLVSSGGSALQFNGNVNTDAGAAPLRTDTNGTPAIQVRGKYVQGAPGLGAGSGCGVLSGASARPASTVDASAGVACGDPSLIPVAISQDYSIDTSVPAELPLPAACPSQRVIRFSPGRYDQTAVATLNSWFSRTGGCTDKTFHFEQGRYWFDANTPGAPAADRHALVLDNPSSNFVFGTSSGWSTDPASGGASAADFPNACQAGSAADTGASIILSARTELRHLSGRLAVCPYTSPSNTQYPTVLQQTTVPTAITVSNPQSSAFTPQEQLISGSPGAAGGPAVFTCNFPAGGTTVVYCNSVREFSFQLSSPLDGPLTGASVHLTGNEVNNNVSLVYSRKVAMTVTLASGATCTTDAADGVPDKSRSATYSLVTGTCAAAITDGSQLDGATVSVAMTYRYQGVCTAIFGNCPLAASAAQSLAIWDIDVVADPWTGTAASVSSAPTTEWLDLANIRQDDTAKAQIVACPGLDIFCALPNSTVLARSVQAAAYGDTAGRPAMAPTAEVDSFGVLLRQQVPANNGVQTGFNLATLPGSTTITLTLADGTTCTSTTTGVPNVPADTYFPMLEPGGASCGTTSLGPTQLTGANLLGATITAEFRLTCAIGGSPNCLFYDPVPLQFLGLVATTDTYTGPVVQSRLTIDSANGASANFFGPAYLKRMALDLHWDGVASGASIFGGEVQLHSLGSTAVPGATTDVVCCTAPEISSRKVRVTSWIDGEPKLTVVAALDRVGGMPSILDWTVCGRNGTCSSP